MNIKFSHPEDAVVTSFPPVPIKKNLPDWYKSLPVMNGEEATIKNCIPVQDILTSGYLIVNSFEFELKKEKFEEIDRCPYRSNNENYIKHHAHQQCPVNIKGAKKDYFKINHGWQIKTPPGYSCLFIQPPYRFNEDFELFPAIVDTDVYHDCVNFPGYIKTDEIITVKPGDPLMQVIPFKRDEWNLEVEKTTSGFPFFDFWLPKKIDKIYKTYFHKKKKYK